MLEGKKEKREPPTPVRFTDEEKEIIDRIIKTEKRVDNRNSAIKLAVKSYYGVITLEKEKAKEEVKNILNRYQLSINDINP